MKKLFYIFFVIFSISYAEPSFAQDPDPDPPEEETGDTVQVPELCSDEDEDTEFAKYRITANVVRCIESVVNEGSDAIIDGYVSNAAGFIFYVISIAIIIFTIRVMFGVARAQGITAVFVGKILLVLYICNPATTDNLKNWRDGLLDFPHTMSLTVMEATQSPLTTPGPDGEVATRDVFDMFDRYILKMFGVNEEDLPEGEDDEGNPKEEEIYIGLAALVSGVLFTGDVGATVAMISLGFVISVVMAMAQAVLFFCTIIIAINFLVAIAPIAVCCILFDPVKRITKVWFQYLLIYVTQPILLMAFLGLVLGILEHVMQINEEIPGVPDQFEESHEAIRMKWANHDGNDVKENMLFDCNGVVLPGSTVASVISHNSMWPSVFSQADSTKGEINSYLDGNAKVGSDVNYGDMSNINLSDCQFSATSLVLDFNNEDLAGDRANSDSYYTSDQLQEFMGYKIAIASLMIMLISFMVEIPKMINMLVGQGVVSDLAQYSTNPTNKIQENIVGDRGYLMQGREALTQQSTKRY